MPDNDPNGNANANGNSDPSDNSNPDAGSQNDDPNMYNVQQGDYVPKIAAARGFSDYRTIWDHGKNAQLKQQRKTPTILNPGDQLYIPDRETRTETRSTDSQHQFQLQDQPLKLRLVVKDMTDKPVAGKPCQMTVADSPDIPSLTTDGTGMVERTINPDAAAGKFTLKDTGIPIDLDLKLHIGDLDPIDVVTGWKGRLNNLGYDAGLITDDITLQLRSAIEEFQCDQKLTVDGICGPQTQAKLKQVHGC